MELMSSLLLCVLVALLPQTLGKSRLRSQPTFELNFDKSLPREKPHMRLKKLLLNINGPPLVSNTSELQSVFVDVTCKRCHSCMDRVLKAHLRQIHLNNARPSSLELQEDVLNNEISYRAKRNIAPTNETMTSSKMMKGKRKKDRAVMVTKFNIDGDVYALKVNEQVNADQKETQTAQCQVYSVKKSFNCDSVEGIALLTSAKRKGNKRKPKKEHVKPASTSTTHKIQTSVFKKREVDNTQVSDNYMTSIEELY